MDDRRENFILVKPDKKAAISVVLIKILFVLLLLAAVIWGVGFTRQSLAEDIIGFFGLSISVFTFYLYTGGLAVLILVFITSLMLLKIEKEGAVLYDDKLLLTKTKNFFFISDMEIPYDNIARINVESGDFLDKMLNTGDVVLELTATSSKEERIDSLSNALQAAQTIQQKVVQHRSRNQAAYDEQNKIDGIFDREGY